MFSLKTGTNSFYWNFFHFRQFKNMHCYSKYSRSFWCFKGTVSRDRYFIEGLNILIRTFCVWADGLKVFPSPIQLLTFYLLLWNYLLILKMFKRTLFKIPFSVIGQSSLVPTSHWLQGNAQELICYRRRPVWFYRITDLKKQALAALHLKKCF
jgi:hypothetical protein